MHTQPAVQTSSTTSSTSGSTTGLSPEASYTTGGSAVTVAPNVTIDSPDSPTLVSMTATIQDPLGSSDQLSAVTTDTPLTSNFANDVLTVSGVDNIADYQTVLQSITYSTNSTQAGDPTIAIMVNNGTTSSPVATVNVTVTQGTRSTGRDHEPGRSDGRRGQHGDLHGGGQRQSGAHACSGK